MIGSEQLTSNAARLAALGFIFTLLAGNFVLVYLLLGQTVPVLLKSTFTLGIILSLAGGFGMLINRFVKTA